MSMSSTMTASKLSNKYSELLSMDTFPGDSFLLDYIASTLDAEFQKATPSLPNIDITTPAGTLNFPVADESQMASIIGKNCADYWSMTVAVTGIPVNICPVVPSTIVSVTNDAAKIETIITNGILTLAGSAEPVVPNYLNFTDIIINAVKTITWIVNEDVTYLSPVPCSGTYTVTVT